MRCGDGFTLVGYSFYSCDTETGTLATDLGSDDTLTQYSACVADADAANICAGVNVRLLYFHLPCLSYLQSYSSGYFYLNKNSSDTQSFF